ncbi:MAG TPA: hypothetical protein PLH93_03110 [Flavobacteriales bacterium]|nr:hypothetical protein [Flavobacteriales bacterium]
MEFTIVRHPVWRAWARWAVFMATLGWLAHAASSAQGTPWSVGAVSTRAWSIMPAVAVLAVVNWWVESVKWRRLMRPLIRLSGPEAFRATLSGTTLGLVTPNRTGEFLGRIAHLPASMRTHAALASLPGSIAQFTVTLVAGALGLMVLWGAASTELPVNPAALLALAAVIAVPSMLLMRPARLAALLLRLPLPRAWRNGVNALVEGQGRPAPAILALSAIRYLVFSLQFVLLLLLFAPEVAWPYACGAVPVIFLITTLVPTAVLTELGVRGSVAVAVLAPLQVVTLPVLSATFTLWLANLALPAIAGGVMLVAARRGSAA